MEGVPYNVVEKVLRIVFSNTEPYPPHRTMWAKRNSGNTFSFYVYNDGEWHDVSGTITIPEISVFLSAFTNDAGFLTADDITGLQEALVSGENIKTINGYSILGSGNIVIEGGGESQEITGSYTTDSIPIMLSTQGGNYNVYFPDSVGYFTLYPNESIEVNSSNSNSTVYIVDKVKNVNPITEVEYDDVLASGTEEATYQNDTNNIKEVKVAISTASTAYDYTINTLGIPKEALRPDVQDTLDKADNAQETLVSGTNIKTINNQSILGSGNLTIQASDAYEIVDIGEQSNFTESSYPNGYYTISYSGSSLYDDINYIWNQGKIPVLKVLLSIHTSGYSIPLYKAPNNDFNGHERAENGNYTVDVTISSNSGVINTRSIGTYSKPSGGIPSTDLASAVQTSLGKADTALQPSDMVALTNNEIDTIWNTSMS